MCFIVTLFLSAASGNFIGQISDIICPGNPYITTFDSDNSKFTWKALGNVTILKDNTTYLDSHNGLYTVKKVADGGGDVFSSNFRLHDPPRNTTISIRCNNITKTVQVLGKMITASLLYCVIMFRM